MNLRKLLPLLLFRVAGHSMLPNYPSGKILLVNQWAYLFSEPKVGEVVVFKYPKTQKRLLKRITKLDSDKIFVQGDNQKDSLDSSSFGPIKKAQIEGKVLN